VTGSVFLWWATGEIKVNDWSDVENRTFTLSNALSWLMVHGCKVEPDRSQGIDQWF